MASICNDERVRFGVMSGHERKPLRLSDSVPPVRLYWCWEPAHRQCSQPRQRTVLRACIIPHSGHAMPGGQRPVRTAVFEIVMFNANREAHGDCAKRHSD